FTSKQGGFVEDQSAGAAGVKYTYTVTNNGPLTCTSVDVEDDKLNGVCVIPSLGPGATTSCTKSTTLSETTTNHATVIGDVVGHTGVCHDKTKVTVPVIKPCVLGYPSSENARTSIAFSENEVLRDLQPPVATSGDTIRLF